MSEPANDRLVSSVPNWLMLLGVALLLTLLFAGSRPLWLPDEGRYAEAAREMISSGDWITPHLNGEPHFTKPPLTYWIIAGSMELLGRNETAVRLVTALPFVGTVMLAYLLGMELGFRRSAFWAGIMLLLSPLPFAAGNIVTPDTLLTFFETLAIYLMFCRVNRHPGGYWHLLGGYAALGLAFMTKGPVGVAVPLLAFIGMALYHRQDKLGRRLLSVWGVVIFLVVALTWYLVVVATHKGLLDYFLGNEVYGRMFTNIHHRGNSVWIYLPVLILGFLPWLLWLRKPIGRLVRALNRRHPDRLDIPRALLWSWLLLPMIIFVISHSRLPLYVLFAFVPMSLLAAEDLATWLHRSRDKASRAADLRPTRLILPIAMGLVLLTAKIVAATLPNSANLKPIVTEIQQRAGDTAFDVYTDRDNLYSLNFYFDRRIGLLSHDELKPDFSRTTFLVLRRPDRDPGRTALSRLPFGGVFTYEAYRVYEYTPR